MPTVIDEHWSKTTNAAHDRLATRGPYIARIGGNPGHFVVVESVENGLVKLWGLAGGVARSQALSDFVNIVSGLVFR